MGKLLKVSPQLLYPGADRDMDIKREVKMLQRRAQQEVEEWRRDEKQEEIEKLQLSHHGHCFFSSIPASDHRRVVPVEWKFLVNQVEENN